MLQILENNPKKSELLKGSNVFLPCIGQSHSNNYACDFDGNESGVDETDSKVEKACQGKADIFGIVRNLFPVNTQQTFQSFLQNLEGRAKE